MNEKFDKIITILGILAATIFIIFATFMIFEIREMFNDHRCTNLPLNEFFQDKKCERYWKYRNANTNN